MRILLNGLAVFGGGSRTYFHNLVPHLGRLGHNHEFVLLHSPWQEMLQFELPSNFTRLVVGPERHSVLLRVLWEQVRLPRVLRHKRVDVMFSPTPATALFCPCPTVIAVRNPNPFSTLDIKDWRYLIRNWVLRTVTRLTARRAAHLIFVSKYSRDVALKVLKVNPSKVAVVYHGTSPHFFEPAKKPVTELFNGQRPYILTVSTITRHKNYPRVLDAFAQLCHSPDLGYDYVFAGGISSQTEFRRIQERMSKPDLEARVHYLGRVPNQDLPPLYQNAELFVLPALLETFGHPLVEAMASGVPIAASNAVAIPEIGGDAVVYFNPYDVDNMAHVMRGVLLNDGLRERLVAAGHKRAKRFSWSTTARQMLDLFESAGNKI